MYYSTLELIIDVYTSCRPVCQLASKCSPRGYLVATSHTAVEWLTVSQQPYIA